MQTHGCCLIRLRRTSNKKSNYSLSELSSLVSSASSSLVRELLTEILIEHPHFIERFKVKMPFHAINYSDKLTTIIHKYDHIIKKNKNRKTAKFIMEMRKFIQEAVESLIQQNAYLPAFELINEVIATLETFYWEPEDERTLLLIEDCYYLWKELLAEAPHAEKGKCSLGSSAKSIILTPLIQNATL